MRFTIETLALIARGVAWETPRLVGARARFARLRVFLRRQSCLKNRFYPLLLER